MKRFTQVAGFGSKKIGAMAVAVVVVALTVFWFIRTNSSAGPLSNERQHGLRVVQSREKVKGYERDCGSGKGCVFGKAWTDDHEGTGGKNGCSTRDDVLALSGTKVVKDGKCTVSKAEVIDAYSGDKIAFERGQRPTKIDIDHIYPLSRAWDMGASRWTDQRRVQFANDIDRNLVAAGASANREKGDKGLAEWLPSNTKYRKDYVCQYAQVTDAYDLVITKDEAKVVGQHCPDWKNWKKK
ncbi:GmrSD restriction endonuclease domain-containing protein [Austwickia chelonae]|uniref:GmrSD restriction endonuclease domain-containing protein n=1 Tax=Austwickia chelonae TaxID=100225 RepID=UPI0019679D7F|nr:DUF1524 domain-containing protein [Austwickia chelonae]